MNVDDIITKTAEERGLSVDLPEKFLSMLPKELCKVVSFESGRDDPTCALTVAVKVEKNGRILEYKVCRNLLSSLYLVSFSSIFLLDCYVLTWDTRCFGLTSKIFST